MRRTYAKVSVWFGTGRNRLMFSSNISWLPECVLMCRRSIVIKYSPKLLSFHFMWLGVEAWSKLNINNGELGSWNHQKERKQKGYRGLVCKYNFNNISPGSRIYGVLRRTQDETIPNTSLKVQLETLIVWSFRNFYNPKLNLCQAFSANIMPNISTRNP